tara:strand:+ start:2248 stop:3144 length:897 start_codon:yes stop_codon:yes gene_type:complete
MWNKHGLIFTESKAQCPIVSENDDYWRIYFTDRNNDNQNIANFIDVEKGNPTKRLHLKTALLSPGKPGSVDSAGVMPTAFHNNYLYYIGWTLRQDVPYFNYTCVAQKISELYHKLGPILSPSITDPGYSGTIGIYKENHYLSNILIGYYLSCKDWLLDENNTLQPSYDIKIAKSVNGIDWIKQGKTAIELQDFEAGISSATVIKHKNVWHMWFSVRHAENFRSDATKAYKIKHATSNDGYNWTRDENYSILPELEFEQIMCAYPNITIFDNKIHMFYNGDGFGKAGIAYATMELENLC